MSVGLQSLPILALGLLSASCLAPPALLPARSSSLEQALERYPPGREVVELPNADGDVLRGVFVPAGPGAPVVLHLLDSSGSVADTTFDFGIAAQQLGELGLASLIVDYTGVGVSEGERSVGHLVPDARVLWNEALRRAGGDRSRVLVRALSIGTIAAAGLLAEGERPGALVLMAPVLPRTVVPRFARAYYGRAGWLAASLFFRPVANLDLPDLLEHSTVPTFAFASVTDPLLSGAERAQLETAIRAIGGTWTEISGDHIVSAALARRPRWDVVGSSA